MSNAAGDLPAYQRAMRELMRRATDWERRYPSPYAGDKRRQHRNQLRRELALLREQPTPARLQWARATYNWGRPLPDGAFPGCAEYSALRASALVALEQYLGAAHEDAPAPQRSPM